MNRSYVLAQEVLDQYYKKAFEDGYQKALLNKGSEGSFSYRQGYENGRRDQKIDDRIFDYDDIDFAIHTARQEGLNDAWECAKRAMLEMSSEELCRTFGVEKWQDLFRELNGEQAVHKFIKYNNN